MFTGFKTMQKRLLLPAMLVICLGLINAGNDAYAQQPTITPNYKDADIQLIIEAVSEVTGRNFIVDPRVKANVTMLSSSPMTPDAFYEAFLSILQVYGYVAVPSGDVIKILPDANVRQMPGWEAADAGRADDIVTKVVIVENVSAAQLVPILRPLIPQYGHLAAHPASNMLIISDRTANVNRVVSIIRRIDQAGDDEFEVLRLTHASAADTVRVVTALQASTRSEGSPASNVTIVADDRTNSVLISGDKADRLRLRALITHLDTPLEEGGDTQVRYLRYANAADLATKLETQYNGATQEGGAPGTNSDISIWADEETNAIIITAPPKIMRSMMTVVDKIDIRRAQVLVEAIVVEVTSDNAENLGITWAAYSDEAVLGATDFSQITPGIVGAIGGASGEIEDAAAVIQDGINLAVGRISENGLSFAAVVQALKADTNSNIMATPTLVTMDNEEAEIQVGQEVPFVTGSYSNTGNAGGAVNPFQTVERKQVGLTLKLTPQINEGDAILLAIQQEVSSVSDSTQAVDLITNNRVITTSVIVDDGDTLVLGGLIRDEMREREQRVPYLGAIPVLGALFRAKEAQLVKTNLMVFIKPTIIRDMQSAGIKTQEKYSLIRDLQIEAQAQEKFNLGDRPTLPELQQQRQPEVIDLRNEAPAEEL